MTNGHGIYWQKAEKFFKRWWGISWQRWYTAKITSLAERYFPSSQSFSLGKSKSVTTLQCSVCSGQGTQRYHRANNWTLPITSSDLLFYFSAKAMLCKILKELTTYWRTMFLSCKVKVRAYLRTNDVTSFISSTQSRRPSAKVTETQVAKGSSLGDRANPGSNPRYRPTLPNFYPPRRTYCPS